MLDHAIKVSSKMPRTAKKEKVQSLRRGKKFQDAMLAGEAALDAIEKASVKK